MGLEGLNRLKRLKGLKRLWLGAGGGAEERCAPDSFEECREVGIGETFGNGHWGRGGGIVGPLEPKEPATEVVALDDDRAKHGQWNAPKALALLDKDLVGIDVDEARKPRQAVDDGGHECQEQGKARDDFRPVDFGGDLRIVPGRAEVETRDEERRDENETNDGGTGELRPNRRHVGGVEPARRDEPLQAAARFGRGFGLHGRLLGWGTVGTRGTGEC